MGTTVVTGASSGIGQALAQALAGEGHELVVVGRNPARTATAGAAITAAAGGRAPVTVIRGDLSTVVGIREVGEQVLAATTRIDVLVHCAGIWPTRLVRTPDGFEESFAVNHLAPNLLTRMLRERLLDSAPARLVQVTAGMYVKGKVDLDRDPTGQSFSRFGTYPSTKLWNLISTMRLAEELAGTGVTVNAVHPGVVRTRLGDSSGPLGLLVSLVKRSWMPPEQGAEAPLRLATSPELAGVTAAYFEESARKPLLPVVTDRDLVQAVLARTASLVPA